MPNKKILIVEDDPEARLGLHLRLKANHYDTCFAADGLSAINEVRKNQPDLVLLDLGLPAGDGFVVIERLKRITSFAALPIIVLTARDRNANKDRALKAGANAFFQKPVQNDVLLATIQRLVSEGPHELESTTEAGGKSSIFA